VASEQWPLLQRLQLDCGHTCSSAGHAPAGGLKGTQAEKGKEKMRRYLPLWMKDDAFEFLMEIVSAVALGYSVVNYLIGG